MKSVIDTGTASGIRGANSRRSFIKKGIAAGAAGVGYALFADPVSVLAGSQQQSTPTLSAGDAALLRFAAAAEILETDFWIQYNELGGVQDSEVSSGTGNPTYTAKLQVLDSDFSQYIHDNTDDEITHFTFLNAYLESKGAAPANGCFSHSARQQGDGIQRTTTAHQPNAAHCGHKLVDPVSQQRQQS